MMVCLNVRSQKQAKHPKQDRVILELGVANLVPHRGGKLAKENTAKKLGVYYHQGWRAIKSRAMPVDNVLGL